MVGVEDLQEKRAEESVQSSESAGKFKALRSSTESLASVKSAGSRKLSKSISEPTLRVATNSVTKRLLRSDSDGTAAHMPPKKDVKDGKDSKKAVGRLSTANSVASVASVSHLSSQSPAAQPSRTASRGQAALSHAGNEQDERGRSAGSVHSPRPTDTEPGHAGHAMRSSASRESMRSTRSAAELSLPPPSVRSSHQSGSDPTIDDMEVDDDLYELLVKCGLLDDLGYALAEHGITRKADVESMSADKREFDEAVLEVSRTTKMSQSKAERKLRILVREMETGAERALRDSVDEREEELVASLEKLFAAKHEKATDPSFDAFMKKKAPPAAGDPDAGQNIGRLLQLLKVWVGWREKHPSPVEALPGQGRTVPGQFELHPFVGANRPKIEATQKAEDGWREALLKHARHAAMRNLSEQLDRTGRLPADRLEHGIRELSKQLHARTEAALHLLESWPRGSGAGELLKEPLVDDTDIADRGVKAEWWLAIVNRAPFVGTRVLVEAFIKPVCRDPACALWFLVPPKFRTKPKVYMSHAWDGSIWDLRPPPDVKACWIDVLAMDQNGSTKHNAAAALETVNKVVDVVAKVGRTCVIVPGERPMLPFLRSWCLLEMASTKEERLELRVGFSEWKKAELEALKLKVEQTDVTDAVASVVEDRQMIEKALATKFGTLKSATFCLQDIIIKAFAHEAMQAFVDTEQADAAEQVEKIERRGVRPHYDLDIVRIWGEEPMKVVTLFGTTWDFESTLGVGKRVKFAQRLQYSREQPRSKAPAAKGDGKGKGKGSALPALEEEILEAKEGASSAEKTAKKADKGSNSAVMESPVKGSGDSEKAKKKTDKGGSSSVAESPDSEKAKKKPDESPDSDKAKQKPDESPDSDKAKKKADKGNNSSVVESPDSEKAKKKLDKGNNSSVVESPDSEKGAKKTEKGSNSSVVESPVKGSGDSEKGKKKPDKGNNNSVAESPDSEKAKKKLDKGNNSSVVESPSISDGEKAKKKTPEKKADKSSASASSSSMAVEGAESAKSSGDGDTTKKKSFFPMIRRSK